MENGTSANDSGNRRERAVDTSGLETMKKSFSCEDFLNIFTETKGAEMAEDKNTASKLKAAMGKGGEKSQDKTLDNMNVKKAASPLPKDDAQPKRAASPLPKDDAQPLRASSDMKSGNYEKRAASPMPSGDGDRKRAASPLPSDDYGTKKSAASPLPSTDYSEKRAASPLPSSGGGYPPTAATPVGASGSTSSGKFGIKGCLAIVFIVVFLVFIALLAKCASCGGKKAALTEKVVEVEKVEKDVKSGATEVGTGEIDLAAVNNRAGYAALATEAFREAGMAVEVRVDGDNNTDITLSTVAMNKAWIDRFETSAMFKEIEAMGFKRLYYSDKDAFYVFREF